jgi:hypothetical protein
MKNELLTLDKVNEVKELMLLIFDEWEVNAKEGRIMSDGPTSNEYITKLLSVFDGKDVKACALCMLFASRMLLDYV